MTVAELIALLQKADPSLCVLISDRGGEYDADPEFTATGPGPFDEGAAFYIETMDTPEDEVLAQP